MRRTTITGAFIALAVAAGLIALATGDYGLSIGDVIDVLTGRHPDPLARFFVVDQRLPRVLAGAAVGIGLAVAGSLTQSLTGNVLGSPDIIGFSAGAAAGAVSAILLFGAAPAVAALGALAGGAATSIIVVGASWSRNSAGRSGGLRLVVVGIAVSAGCHALTTLLVARASLTGAQDATMWLTGSLGTMTWQRLGIICVALAIAVPAAVLLRRPLETVTLGDDVAAGLGVPVARVRALATVVAVALVAGAVATAGPIGFVALAAPHIARMVTRARGLTLLASGAVGSALVLVADVIAQRVFAPIQLPVGIVTGIAGGVYIVVLLIVQAARERSPQ